MNLLQKTYNGIKGLLSGMGLTFGYFIRPDKVITQQYPENRNELKLPARTHTRIELVREGEDQFRCKACGICVRACPNGSLSVEKGKDAAGKTKLEKFVYHFERCTLCGLCVDSCRTEALQMSQKYETAVFDSSQLLMILNESEVDESSKPAKDTPAPDRLKAELQTPAKPAESAQPSPATPPPVQPKSDPQPGGHA